MKIINLCFHKKDDKTYIDERFILTELSEETMREKIDEIGRKYDNQKNKYNTKIQYIMNELYWQDLIYISDVNYKIPI